MFMYDVILFCFLYLYSFYLVFNGNDWFIIWLGLEINMMMFIMIMFKRYSIFNIESCYKYFFVQSLGSVIFMGLIYINSKYLESLMCLVLGYKIGVGPFFFWFISICFGISWMSCFILMVFQKVMPLLLISMFVSWLMFFMVFFSLFIGVIGSFNQKDLKLLLAYSSVYHLGWIFMCMLVGSNCWVNYMLMYMMMLLPVIYLLSNNNIFTLMEMTKVKNKFLLVILMLSVAGMPPFLGFFLKWFAFIQMMSFSIFWMMIIVISSIIMFYIYFRVIYDVLLGYFCYGNWGNWFSVMSNYNYYDFMCVFGMLFGVVLSLFLVML